MKIPLEASQEKSSSSVRSVLVESLKDFLRNKAVANNSDVNNSSQSNPKLSQTTEAQVSGQWEIHPKMIHDFF
jgi:hypothetical protein